MLVAVVETGIGSARRGKNLVEQGVSSVDSSKSWIHGPVPILQFSFVPESEIGVAWARAVVLSAHERASPCSSRLIDLVDGVFKVV